MLMAIQDSSGIPFGAPNNRDWTHCVWANCGCGPKPEPFATLVAVIAASTGRPACVLTNTLSRIHGEYDPLLENFAGDSSPGGIEADLAACVAHRQQAPCILEPAFRGSSRWSCWRCCCWWRVGYPRLVGRTALGNYVALLRAQPGIVITESGRQDGKTWSPGCAIRSRTIRNHGARSGAGPGAGGFSLAAV